MHTKYLKGNTWNFAIKSVSSFFNAAVSGSSFGAILRSCYTVIIKWTQFKNYEFLQNGMNDTLARLELSSFRPFRDH